ncbi:ComEC/Rec2 family competence protein [Paenibacillus polymyxa]|uniref:ComEC/Rec2 family competence protein n=1 Tax=Paenibacillus polymyxa TaxID=1406 RepID=UPI0015E187FD|nr:MBL fold metallo-hydrolase [Paenibacillus polymyxa]
MLNIRMLKAFSGDSFIISYNNGDGRNTNILIDGGIARTYRTLKKEIKDIEKRNEVIDLLILTHTDSDHIGGILKYFQDEDMNHHLIRKVLFNSASSLSKYFNTDIIKSRELTLSPLNSECSYREGKSLEDYLKKNNIWNDEIIKFKDKFLLSGAKLTILSPTIDTLKELNKNWELEENSDTECGGNNNDYNYTLEDLFKKPFCEDRSLANKSSIAFLFEYSDKNILMLGDAHALIIANSLKSMGYSTKNKLKLDCVKLSHHGSKFNTSEELLSILDCSRYLISTNKSNRPHKETLAKIINSQQRVSFYYNYEHPGLFNTEEKTFYNLYEYVTSNIALEE